MSKVKEYNDVIAKALACRTVKGLLRQVNYFKKHKSSYTRGQRLLAKDLILEKLKELQE